MPSSWNVSELMFGFRSYNVRFSRLANPGTQQRFLSTLDVFFWAIGIQAHARKNHIILSLDTYVTLRRDSSGCRPCWALIEVANHLNIPDYVMEHPAIRKLGDETNDLVAWSNDIFSYNKENVIADTHNMIPIVMHEYQVDLQEAIDFVGRMCQQAIDRFNLQWRNLPKWDEAIDRDVQIYANGLAMWIIG